MATAAIVGLGGLGCPIALTLAEAGVEHLVLIDDDVVELSNLQRQVLYTTEDLGQPKVEVARARLTAHAPDLRVTTHRERLDDANADRLLSGVAVILDGTDDPAARFVINDWALAHRVPAVLGGIHRFDGLVLGVGPGFGPCFRCLFEDAPGPGEVGTCADAGVLGPLAGVTGHLQAARALGLLAGDHARHTGFFTTVDGLRGRVRDVPLPEATGCPACGGLAGRLDITREACPFTFVRARLALEPLSPGALLDIVMRPGEAARNVPRGLAEDGHEILCQGNLDDEAYRVVVRRAGAPPL